jgi:hypothetical protein
VDLAEKLYNEDDQELAEIRAMAAEFFESQQMYAEAESLYTSVVHFCMSEKRSHPELAVKYLRKLATILKRQGNDSLARQMEVEPDTLAP